MKIRNGFISNSSSSSFICGVTGEVFEVNDGCFWEADLCQCTSGHIFKKELLVPFTPKIPNRASIIEKLDNITDSKRECKSFREMSMSELKQKYINAFYIKGENKYLCNVNECPICTLKNLNDSMLLAFTLKKSSLSRKNVLEQIQKEFMNLEQFQEYIKDNRWFIDTIHDSALK